MRCSMKAQGSKWLLEFDDEVLLLHDFIDESLKGTFQFAAEIAFSLGEERESLSEPANFSSYLFGENIIFVVHIAMFAQIGR